MKAVVLAAALSVLSFSSTAFAEPPPFFGFVLALVVDAKDDEAAAFYRHHDFVALSEARRHYVLPLLARVRRPL